MKKLLWSVIAFVSIPTLLGCAVELNLSEVPSGEKLFVLAEGRFPESGVFTKRQSKVISTQEEYATELAIYTETAPLKIDFKKGRVLLVDMGRRSSGGYTVRVASVVEKDNWVVANVELVMPGPNCIVTMALTNPYQFVFIPSLKEILLSEKWVVTEC